MKPETPKKAGKMQTCFGTMFLPSFKALQRSFLEILLQRQRTSYIQHSPILEKQMEEKMEMTWKLQVAVEEVFGGIHI